MPETTNNIAIKVTTEGVENAVKGLESLSSVLNKLNKSTQDVANVNVQIKQLSTNVSSLGNVLRKGINIAGFTIGAKAIGQFINAAVGYVEDVNLFTVSMGQFTDRAYDYAQTVQDIMGIDAGQWMRNQSVFMSLASGFGIASDRAYLMSEQLTQLSYDLASLYNLDVENAFLKLKSGFAGELEPLRAIGVDLSKANIELAAHELGITKTYNAMTQAEKAQLRYYIIMQQTTAAQGDMARTLQAPANQLRIFQSQLQLTARAIGSIFIPMLNAILPVAIAVVRAIRTVIAAIASLFGYTLPEMNWEPLKDTTGAVADDLDDANGSAKKLKKQLAGFDEINNLTTPDPSGGGGSVGGGGWADFELPTYDFLGDAVEQRINGIGAAINNLLPIIAAAAVAVGTFLVVTNWGKIVSAFESGLLTIGAGIEKVWVTIMQNPIAAIIALIAGVIAYMVILYNTNEEFRAKVNEIFADIIPVIQGFVESVRSNFDNLYKNIIHPIISAIAAFFVALWESCLKDVIIKIGQFIGELVAFAATIWSDVISPIINWLGNTLQPFIVTFLGVVGVLIGGFVSSVGGVISGLITTLNGFVQIFRGIITVIGGLITGNWKQIWEGAKTIASGAVKALKGIIEAIINIVKSPLNFVITYLNKFIQGLNKIKIPSWVPGVGGKGINIALIPKLATGGIITEPTQALIGEAGTEAVLPLENHTEWMDIIAGKIAVKNNNSNDRSVEVLEAILDAVNNLELQPVISDDTVGEANSRYQRNRTRILGV